MGAEACSGAFGGRRVGGGSREAVSFIGCEGPQFAASLLWRHVLRAFDGRFSVPNTETFTMPSY